MKTIKVISSSRTDNTAAYELIKEIAEANGIPIKLEMAKLIAGIGGSDLITSAGVMIDGEQAHVGVPSRSEIEGWLFEEEEDGCCGFCGGAGKAYLESLKD